MKSEIKIGDEVVARQSIPLKYGVNYPIGTKFIVQDVRKVNNRYRVSCKKKDTKGYMSCIVADIPISYVMKSGDSVWVVNQITNPFDTDNQEIFNCVFSSFRKAYNFVKREFENDGVGEFDGKALINDLCISNERCEYNLEECEIQ